MPKDAQSVTPDSLPADVEAAPSAEVVQEQPVVETPVVTEPPFNEHPRWKEVQAEKEALREQNRQLLELAQRVAPQPQAAPVHDPWEGFTNHPDPATAQFYQNQQRLFRAEASRAAAEQIQPLQQAVGMGRQHLAQITLSNFYADNPDITPNSPEAAQIAERVSQGYPLEDAKWVVMGPRYAQQAKQVTQRTAVKTQQATQKRQLPPDSGAGIPAASGLPQQAPSFRNTLLQEMERAERDAAEAQR